MPRSRCLPLSLSVCLALSFCLCLSVCPPLPHSLSVGPCLSLNFPLYPPPSHPLRIEGLARDGAAVRVELDVAHLVLGFGFRVSGFEFRVSGFECGVLGFGFWVSDFGFGVGFSGFRVLGFLNSGLWTLGSGFGG